MRYMQTVYFYKLPVNMNSSSGSDSNESACNVGDLGLIPGLGRSLKEGNGYPLQFSGLENSMDYTFHGVTKSQAELSDFHFTSPVNVNLLEKIKFMRNE